MTSILLDSRFLNEFNKNSPRPFHSILGEDDNGDVMDFKPSHYKKMLMVFFPALGVKNLQLGTTDKGRPINLVFTRGNRVEQIDPQTLKQVCFDI